jgi:hypothetical protein
MTKLEMLLVMLAEEASEVSQGACKCIRFTAQHKSSKLPKSNFGNLEDELADLEAMVALVKAELHSDDSYILALPEEIRKIADKKLTTINTSIRLGVSIQEENSNELFK